MKPSAILLTAVIAAIIASSLTSALLAPRAGSSPQKEAPSAFARVTQSGILRCGYAIWPPAMIKDPNTGVLSGINHDAMEEIGRELNLKIEWTEEVSFGNYIEGLNTGRYDALCSTQWPDPARIRFQTYTRPYYFTPVYAYVRANDARFDGAIEKINDSSITIATIDGDMSATEARMEFPRAKQYALPQTADAQELFLAVVNKKADFFTSDEGNFAMYDKNNPGLMQRVKDVPPSRIYGEFIPVREGETELRDILNVAITSLINSGKIDQIIDRYSKNIYMKPARDYK